MMEATLCRLCSFSCDKFKCLFDDKKMTEVYKISVKYFNPSLLDFGVICTECWQHIYDFYSFQQWVLNAQLNQENVREIIIKENSMDDSYNLKSDRNIRRHSFDSSSNISNSNIVDQPNHVLCYKDKEKNQIEMNPYKCETCGASFAHYGNLRRHIRKKHKLQHLRKWICKYCSKIFKNRCNLERHENQTHANSISRQEDHLDIKYDEEENSTNRLKKPELISNEFIYGKTNANNEKCVQEFSIKEESINSSESGLEVGTDIKPYEQIHLPALDITDIKDEISLDSKNDSNTNNLLKNVNPKESNSVMEKEDVIVYDDLIAKWKSFLECPKCNQNLTSFSMLNEHFRSEHSEECCYIVCCDEVLNGCRSIVEHLQLHENSDAFKCVDCGKIFKNSKGLSSHKLQVHNEHRSVYHLHLCYCKRAKELHAEYIANGEKIEYDTFVCCQRKKKILEDDALIAEWKKDLNCRLCGETFPYYSLMRIHFYHKHPGEKYYIFCCQRKMSRISDALEHIRFHLDPHTYECKICNVTFSGRSSLTKHMRNSHTDSLSKYKWACDECNKTFKVRQILIRHKNVCHTKKT